MRRILVLISFLLLVIINNGCTVQKKKGEVSKLGKLYHNTTALYNGYFNADLLMQEAVITLESQYQDNYNKLLPLYPYTEASNPKAVAANLDKAIEKVSIVATIHDPSQWVDDCYVLLGKAQYLKQDYETAEKTFEFFVDEFNPLNRNKSRLKKSTEKKKAPRAKSTKRPTKQKAPKKVKPKKTKKKKPAAKKKKPSSKKRTPGTKKREPKVTTPEKDSNAENESTTDSPEKTADKEVAPINSKPNDVVSSAEKDGMFGHKPVYQEGILWLARTYIHRERYTLAEYYINKVIGDTATPKDIRKEIPVVKAFYHIKKKEYDEAVKSLEQAIELSSDKYEKARFTFIIAQLHQASGRQDKAFAAYNEVIKMHPQYEMEFNAQLNLSKAAWASGQESAKETMDRLEKMAKEEKNFDYRDQIYFTMGTINLKLKERDLAIENFRQSIKYNIGNSAQSSESYYALATYFFEEEEYDEAKFHYDSTLISLPQLDERYEDVKRRSENLKEIAGNIQVIKLQDSLLRVAAMSIEKQREIAASIKKKTELASKPKTLAPKTGPGFATAVSASSAAGAGANKSNFFAYDINKVRRGQNEFRKKYGSRALEDDWRRSNKPSSAITQNTSEEDIAKKMTDDEVKEILRGVPFSPKDKALAINKIEEAYFELGKLYRTKLEHFEKSTQSLETLLERNSNTVFKLETYYYAYLSYTDLNNPAKANYFLDKLKTEFPDSKYTLSITDPNYAASILNEAKKAERAYDQAYLKFENRQYQESYDILEELGSEESIQAKSLEAKIDLLKAMCDGNLQGQAAYITSLNYVVKKHPNSPEQARASEILRFIKGDNQAFDPILYTENSEEFSKEPDKLHYILVVLYSNSSKDMTSAKIDISAFNQKKYNDAKLKISSIFLNKDDGSQIILIRKFDDMNTAMDYYKDSQGSAEEYVKGDFKYDIFAVTQKSYREIIKQKSVNAYRQFYQNNYLN